MHSNSFLYTPGVLLVFTLLVYWSRLRRTGSLPPGPKGTWFSGVARLIPATEPWKVYAQWGKIFGSPLLSFRVYNKRMIVINDATAILELLNNRASNYSDRPKAWMFQEICGRKKAVFNISSLDSRHKRYRKLLQGYLGRERASSYIGVLESEISILLECLNKEPNQYHDHLRRLSAAIIMKLAYGYTVTEDDKFIKVAEESSKISSWALAPGRWLVDYYPIVRFIPSFLPGGRWKRQGKAWREQLKELSDVPHQWVKSQMEAGTHTESFTSCLLQPEGQPHVGSDEEDIIKWSAGGLYAGAADTTVSALTSFLLIMALHPGYQSTAQQELDSVLPLDQVPDPADIARLPYLRAILTEILRFAPVANIALPHKVVKDDTYAGYYIPKDTTIIPNVWAVMHDRSIYPDPYTFDPNRFYNPHSWDSVEEGRQVKDNNLNTDNQPDARNSVDASSSDPAVSNNTTGTDPFIVHVGGTDVLQNRIGGAHTGSSSATSVNVTGPTPTIQGFASQIPRHTPVVEPWHRSNQIDPMKFAFGFGRRTCPGIYFAETMIMLTMARILQRYSIKLPAGSERPSVEFTTGITSHIKSFAIDIVARSTSTRN